MGRRIQKCKSLISYGISLISYGWRKAYFSISKHTSVINQSMMLTLVFTYCYILILHIRFFYKTRWSTREILSSVLPFKCVIGKQYNLGKTSSLNYHSCQEIAEVCWEAIASIMYKGFCSVFDSFLLIYYQHKLKNTEMVSAFYCWYT